MKVFLHYQDNDDSNLHKTLKITLPKSWKAGPTSKLLGQFVESYNSNEKFSSSNPLNADAMYLAMREEASSSSGSHTLIALASDAITIESIPDRGDVYIMHGPSRTLQEIEDERKATAEREAAEKANTVACTHLGCKNRFPRGGPYPDCRYHASPPVFHETAKFWSCCPQKKAYDWEEFQEIPGCLTGVCTDLKDESATSGKQFLGGTDLREKAGEAQKLKSIDDFNKSQEAGGSDAAPVLDRLRSVLGEMGVEAELFDQVVEGMKKDHTGVAEDALLDDVASDLGKKLKDTMKEIAREQLRIK